MQNSCKSSCVKWTVSRDFQPLCFSWIYFSLLDMVWFCKDIRIESLKIVHKIEDIFECHMNLGSRVVTGLVTLFLERNSSTWRCMVTLSWPLAIAGNASRWYRVQYLMRDYLTRRIVTLLWFRLIQSTVPDAGLFDSADSNFALVQADTEYSTWCGIIWLGGD